MRRFCCVKKAVLYGSFFALVFVVSPVAGVERADELMAAQQVMQRTTDELLRRLNVNFELYVKDARSLYQMIEEVVLPVIDIETFARLTLGKHWQSLGKVQRRGFIESFQSMLIRTYGKRLLLTVDIKNLKIEYIAKEKSDSGKKYQVVGTRVVFGGSETPLSVSYSLIKQDGWRVFDIIIDGTSMARQLRSAYVTEIEESGFDALLERLQKADVSQNQ